MAKRSNDMPLSEAINKMLHSYHLADRVQLADLKNNWEKLFGKTMSKYSKPISLEKGQLKIYVEQAPLKMQINYNKEKVMTIINDYFKIKVVSSVQII